MGDTEGSWVSDYSLVGDLCAAKAYSLALAHAVEPPTAPPSSRALGATSRTYAVFQLLLALVARLGGVVENQTKAEAFAESLVAVGTQQHAATLSPGKLCATLYDAARRAAAGIRMPGDREKRRSRGG